MVKNNKNIELIDEKSRKNVPLFSMASVSSQSKKFAFWVLLLIARAYVDIARRYLSDFIILSGIISRKRTDSSIAKPTICKMINCQQVSGIKSKFKELSKLCQR